MYSRREYPRCVRSHFHDTTMSGFKHALSYVAMTLPGSKGNTERIYRKTLFKVKPQKPPLLVVKAYVDSIIKKKDNVPQKLNSTGVGLAGNPQCLLWRRAAGTSEEHKACISAFAKICRIFKGHETMYKKEACA
uniref:Lipocalin n=1 Tax=Rhipicephalus zambeziensis TaxID=60191 RepID=A0A224YMJ4_9ACAR